MSNAAHALKPRVHAAATAIANARAGRGHGAPAVANVLDILPAHLFAEVVHDAHAVLATLDGLAPEPRAPGPLNAADAQILRIERGADAVAIFAWPPGDGPVEVAVATTGNLTSVGTIAQADAGPVAIAAAALTPSRPEARS